MSQTTTEILLSAGTAVVSDVCDEFGLEPRALASDLWPTLGYGRPFAGPAYTLCGTHRAGPMQGDRDKLRAIDEMTPGVVPLFAGEGMRGVCWFGDLLSSAMKCRGVAGVVVDGGVRDLAFLRGMDLPMMVRYRTPCQAIGRWKLTARREPVQVRGALADRITVEPGDILVADDDGVIVVPAAMADRIAARAVEWESKDQRAREDILDGMKLLDAIEKHGAL